MTEAYDGLDAFTRPLTTWVTDSPVTYTNQELRRLTEEYRHAQIARAVTNARVGILDAARRGNTVHKLYMSQLSKTYVVKAEYMAGRLHELFPEAMITVNNSTQSVTVNWSD